MKAAPLGVLSALTASACCVGPAVLGLLGLGGLGLGAVVGRYHPWFIGAAVVLLASGWYRYVRDLRGCAKQCRRPGRFTTWSLMISSVIVAVFALGR